MPAAHAQAPEANWPSKPIRWIVPFPPGGAMDAIARTLGEKAGRTLGQPFVIENRPGAGGNIGADFVAKQPGDGYTLMISSIGMATNKPLYRKLSYDPIKDFAPVGVLAVVPNILVTNSTQPNVKRSEEHTSELQSPCNLVCRLLLEKKKNQQTPPSNPDQPRSHFQ